MKSLKILFGRLIAVAVTLALVVVAVVVGLTLWNRYMLSPWTRDGRVRAETVSVAPEVSGPVADVLVDDNQFVHKGDVLFIIDPQRFKIALTQAQATADSRKQQMDLASTNAERRANLTTLAVSPEEKLQYASNAVVAKADYTQALAAIDLAKLDLERSVVRSPVNGYVTNLRLRKGDYAAVGKQAVTVIDSDSFWVAGYFEETKLHAIAVKAPVTIKLMGFDQPLTGHVESLSRGISDTNGTSDAEGLASVNPVFTWVRLAQRIPVRVAIDQVPDHVVLAAGMTCSLEIVTGEKRQGLTLELIERFNRLLSAL